MGVRVAVTTFRVIRSAGLSQPLVIDWCVGVEPIGAGIDVELENLGGAGSLQQKLTTRDEFDDALCLCVVQMKEFLGARDVHVGAGQETFGGAVFDDGAEDVEVGEILTALRREEECGVSFAPGLEGFGDVGLHGRVRTNRQASSSTNSFSWRLGVIDGCRGAMEDVEEERLEEHREVVEPGEVERLEPLKRERVFVVVEEVCVRTAVDPASECIRDGARQHVGEREEPALRWVERVETLYRFGRSRSSCQRQAVLAGRTGSAG